MENRTISDKYTEIAVQLINEKSELQHIRDSEVTICYLVSDKEKRSKGRVVFGDCEKVADRYRWAVPCDFIITLYAPNIEHFTEEQIEILLFHELLHVGIDIDGNEEIYSIVPHDVEDFDVIISKYGLNWNKT